MKDIKNKRINVNYVITESIKINNIEYVLGKHQLTEKYVTWYYRNCINAFLLRHLLRFQCVALRYIFFRSIRIIYNRNSAV